MNKNQKIFRWVFIIFTLIMAGLAIQMAMSTTAPWNKKKHKTNIEIGSDTRLFLF
ncbi:hypothetical protein [Arcicella rigui]|uniref:Uncharacterized protein n=1 Tax=Arcicella rigui TaxID=797020 RepID=A0ABU5QEV0_9BACT|nr:hypothetical protein [Arcicella rigui]MEA5141385.1 hypothetical protein [Arcicella rigui]